MPDKAERAVRQVYNAWKEEQQKDSAVHPGEELLGAFADGKLPPQESMVIKEHILVCRDCAEYAALQMKLLSSEEMPVPEELLGRVRDLAGASGRSEALEIALRIKDTIWEVITTTGDILMGQELIPAPLLRSRQIKGFKDQVIILKDFAKLRVEVKVENKGAREFNVVVLVKEKATARILKDLRVTLMKDDLELESYVSSEGAVTFEHVVLGKYKVEVAGVKDNAASIILDIKA